jgi:hypothetical protein
MRLGTFATFGGRYIDTVFAVGCEHAMKPGQVHPGLGHQRRQLGDLSMGAQTTMQIKID